MSKPPHPGPTIVCRWATAVGTRGPWNVSLLVLDALTAAYPVTVFMAAPAVQSVDCGAGPQASPTCAGGAVVAINGSFFGANASAVTVLRCPHDESTVLLRNN